VSGPLDGTKVLSFGRMLSGPFATMLLGDLGAEVVKVEAPKLGDLARYASPFIEKLSSYFLSINRGKKSISLDLKHERAKKVVFELVKGADILLENFRPGVMERLGFGYETLREVNPGIIYASLSGFGQNGPYAQRAAFDMIAQGMGGVMSITGEPGRPPVRLGYSMGDIGASLFTCIAILAALHERQKSGRGQWIDVAMLDSQVALCENACARYFATGEIPGPLGSRHPLFTPFEAFPTKDGYVVVVAQLPEDWRRFCEAAGKEEWATDERFRSLEARLEHYDEFVLEMNALMRSRTTEEWIELLDRHRVMCGPVNNIEQVVKDPHINEREMIVEVEHPRLGRLKVVGTPMRFSRTPCRIEKASPELGEHTDEILSAWAGFSKEEIQELKEAGVL
jgi:crotonobetainyl-CoA:carnitine CoA-transferase CaiB-like acyl-CoA transferase